MRTRLLHQRMRQTYAPAIVAEYAMQRGCPCAIAAQRETIECRSGTRKRYDATERILPQDTQILTTVIARHNTYPCATHRTCIGIRIGSNALRMWQCRNLIIVGHNPHM